MSGFFFAFIAVLLASLGGRDQLLVAQLSERQGPRIALLVVAVAMGAAMAALWAWLALALDMRLPPNARQIFAGIALVLAGGEALVLSPRKAAAEPTRSLFAFALVLGAIQVTDAARFLILALALLTAAPVPVALGGAAGTALALGAAWSAPEFTLHPLMRRIRRGAGAVLLVCGTVLAARAIG